MDLAAKYDRWIEMVNQMLDYCLKNADNLSSHFMQFFFETLEYKNLVVPDADNTDSSSTRRQGCYIFDGKIYAVRDYDENNYDLAPLSAKYDCSDILEKIKEDWTLVVWAGQTVVRDLELDLLNYDKENENWKEAFDILQDIDKLAYEIYKTALLAAERDENQQRCYYIDLQDCWQRADQMSEVVNGIFNEIGVNNASYSKINLSDSSHKVRDGSSPDI